MSTNWDWPSAKWWKFDFHSHTPASDDYGKGPNHAEFKQISPTEWLINYMRQGIDCVAVTDHNSGAWIDLLKQALGDMKNRHPEYPQLYLFPGVEITVQGNIHILAIFPLDKGTSDIDSLLGAVRYRGKKGKSDGCSECSAVEVIDEIARAGGLAIPAHVNQERGLFVEYRGNTLEQVLDNSHIFAMELTDLSYSEQSYKDKYLRLKWAEVLGSDSHHPSGTVPQHYPGSHFTWVKMSIPSYDGLRLALTDGNLSLKRSDNFTGDPNSSYGSLVVESITVDNAKYLGRGKSFSCKLNPWLNTIIGGRGTGKSTLLEFLRIAFKRQKELPQSLANDFLKYSLVSANRQEEGLLTEETKITIIFRKDGSRFKIIWTDTGDRFIEEETAPQNWTVSNGDITQRFPIRIYSQKQIFEIAKHPQALLHVVDDTPAVNRRDWQLVWDKLVSKYFSICAQMRETQSDLKEEEVIKGQLEDVKRKLRVFEKTGYANVLKNYQRRQNQSKAIDSWEETWAFSAKQIRDISCNLLPPELDSQYFDILSDDDKELIDKVEIIRAVFAKLQSEMNTVAQQIDEARSAWRQCRLNLKISDNITRANKEYAELEAKLYLMQPGEPQTYDVLVQQRQDLEEKLKEVSKKRDILVQYQKNAQECLDNLYEHRVKLTKFREKFLNDTIADNHYVRINVIPFGNKSTIETELRDLIGRVTGFDRDIGVVDGDGLLAILTQNSFQTMEENIANLKSTLLAIHENDSTAVGATKDRRFATFIQRLTPEQMDRIHCWFPEDSLDVRFSFNNGKSFKPLDQGSPGQKTAALLAFILSYGREPLVLDQPEDDLDNKLIYDLIVSQLRDVKQKRQVLIVTHNANIVVNGDAENIIALDVKAGQTIIVAQGGLQEPSIREEICRVMEGGKDAFDRRYKRINAGL